jgi:hypothetical protein
MRLYLIGLFAFSSLFAGEAWIPATDQQQVKRVAGRWSETGYRGASRKYLAPSGPKAALEFSFSGTGLAVVLESHGLSFTHLGEENLNAITVIVDGKPGKTIYPIMEDRDVVVVRGLPGTRHDVRVEVENGGVRVAGFRALQDGEGDLSFLLHGESNRFLTDVRILLRLNGKLIRSDLMRNWLTGQCRIAGIPAGPGYEVDIIASGWETKTLHGLTVAAERDTVLPPVFLRRTRASSVSGVEFPLAGKPAILQAGQSFETRFAMGASPRVTVHLERRVGPALISRPLAWVENKDREHDGKSEGVLTTPVGTPPGVYDLVFRNSEDRRNRERIAARAVHVVPGFPRNPVFLTFGHLDTWGQEQSEYLDRLAEVSNLIAPDMVLVSNETNAAYASGALSRLDMPYLITFGNHRVSGHEEWYGRPVSIVDFGPDLSILNISYPWHGDLTPATALLQSRAGRACRIINAFESDAPVDLLDRFRIAYLHDAHGEGKRVMTMGNTPTQRAGKENSESFRVVRFDGCRPVSFTYNGHPTAPVPMVRTKPAPLRATYSPANDGQQATVTARIENDWEQAFPDGRVTLVMPKGAYQVDRGRIESAAASDDGRFTVLSIRLDIPAKNTVEVTAARQPQ